METNQPGRYVKVLSTREVLERFGVTKGLPIDIKKTCHHKLKTNLIVAQLYQSYSLAIQYMNNWFYKRFPKNFFKHKYLDLSHIHDQTQRYTMRELIKTNKPSAHITVDEDTEYNRSNIDLYNLGLTLYNNRCNYRDAFFIDRERNTYISIAFGEVRMEFGFNIHVSTKSVQDDVFALCDMAFRGGGSQKNYVDIDYPIPHELIGQVACDAGLCNEDGMYEVNDMLHYFNMRSKLALMYKFNEATGNMEFFLRIPRCRIHIRTSRIQKQQGQQRNMIYNDFGVNFTCEVFFPYLKFFAYYSLIEREHLESYTVLDTKSFLFGITTLANIPAVDEHGWPWEFRSKYELSTKEEMEAFNNKQPVTIDIDPIFINELREVIDATKANAISPSRFINIMAFNWVDYIQVAIDWENMKLTFTEPLTSTEIHFVVYIDKEFMHNTLGNIKMFKYARLRPNDNHLGPDIELGTKLPNL
jgi:hypothetical protein